MLQMTVFIKLTGLLFLTPSTQAGDLPMHVLMPATESAPMRHVPEIGYPSSAADCRYTYDPAEGVCYVNLDGWYVEIGPPGNPSAAALPPGATNLSSALNRYVDRSLFGETPDARLRSRVTLNAGAPGRSCARFLFKLGQPLPNGQPSDSVPLTNVLDWEIQGLSEGSLVLVRRPLNPRPGHDTPEEVGILMPDANHAIKLFIRHVPEAEAMHLPTPLPEPGTPVTHFNAYYDLLGVPSLGRNLPTLRSSHGPDAECTWSGASSVAASASAGPAATGHGPPNVVRPTGIPAGAGTAACMVASGLPTPP
ncbi:MAG: hypothetical protein ACJ8GN_04930 [Longimicrobiaceae bacterium]